MKIAAVVIERWRLPIFTRHLNAGGYAYTITPGPAQTLFMRVEAKDLAELGKVVAAAQAECTGVGHA